MILDQLFEDANDDLGAEDRAQQIAQNFLKWVAVANEEQTIGELMQSRQFAQQDGRIDIQYYANGLQFNSPRWINMGFAYRPGGGGGSSAYISVEEAGGRNAYFVMVVLDYDPKDQVDIVYKLKWSQVLQELVHELTHYMDRRRQKAMIPPESSEDRYKYFNSPLEVNAFYQQGVHNVVEDILTDVRRKTFDPTFVETYEAFNKRYRRCFSQNYLAYLFPLNKRRFEARFYGLWQAIRDRVNGQTLRGLEPVGLPAGE
jgi:hypothetical protein